MRNNIQQTFFTFETRAMINLYLNITVHQKLGNKNLLLEFESTLLEVYSI